MRDGAHTDMSGHTISAAGASADTRVSRGWADRDLLIVVFRLHRTARHGGHHFQPGRKLRRSRW